MISDKKIARLFAVSILLFAMASCQKAKPEPLKAGVILSFDDAYVDEWCQADSALQKYGWKATFCVCRIDSIGAPQIAKLRKLQDEGHEIAGHGYHHYNAIKFVQSNGVDAYLKQEIDPMLVSMRRLGFRVTSFAYPYGERLDKIDKAISPRFKIIRGRAFGGEVPEKEGSYFNRSKIVLAFDIDNDHVHFSMPYLTELLDFARKHNKVLLLCAHRPVTKLDANYQVEIETLEFVCRYVKEHDMNFYTLSDLDSQLQ